MLKRIIPFSLFLLATISISSQTELSNKEFYKWFDAVVSQENIGLMDGLEYRDLYKGKNDDHKFYSSSSIN